MIHLRDNCVETVIALCMTVLNKLIKVLNVQFLIFFAAKTVN